MDQLWRAVARGLRDAGKISAEQCSNVIAIITAMPDAGRAERIITALVDQEAANEDERKAIVEQVAGMLFLPDIFMGLGGGCIAPRSFALSLFA